MDGYNQSGFRLGFFESFCWKKGFLALEKYKKTTDLDEFKVSLFFSLNMYKYWIEICYNLYFI